MNHQAASPANAAQRTAPANRNGRRFCCAPASLAGSGRLGAVSSGVFSELVSSVIGSDLQNAGAFGYGLKVKFGAANAAPSAAALQESFSTHSPIQ
jgi:hypothetical protein